LKKKKTVGQESLELSQKTPENISIIEQQEAMQQDYMKNLLDTVDIAYKQYPSDFFVEVITKNEKLMPNVFRNYFVHRVSCPTPNYDQSVYKYNREAGQVEYIWTIPSRDATHHLVENRLIVHKDERQLLDFCLKFASGDLFKLMKRLNGEAPDSPIIA
jgi:hypothetical protein